MGTKYGTLILFWLVFCVLHSLLANKKLKENLEGKFIFKWIPFRIWYNVFAFASLTAILIYHFSFPTAYIIQDSLFISIIGYLFSLTGLVIMLICIRKYFLQLSGIKDSYTDVLQVSGIHTYVRHPLYAGTFLFIIGLLLASPQWHHLIAVTIIIVYTLIGIRLEEKKLVHFFGQQYLDYKKEVPALIPRIKR